MLHLADPLCWARESLHVALDAWQAEVIAARGEQRLILASRQSGKSWTTAVRACHEAIFYAPAMILLASPSETQSKELFRKITGFLRELPDAPKAIRENRPRLN